MTNGYRALIRQRSRGPARYLPMGTRYAHMNIRIAALMLMAFIGCTAFGSAEAGPWGRHRVFVGGYFGPHDVVIWRGGGWRHGWYGGRFGWWWVVGGAWYFYNAPVYPYPDPYVPAAY